jgi:excinuclease ABC subunit B
MDFFPEDFLLFLDESHMTIPQVRGMFNGDRARKEILVEHGFRLPSCLDNRPLKWDEFRGFMKDVLFVSATPGDFELENSASVAEQLIRPTGVPDPEVEIHPATGQVDHLLAELRDVISKGERAIVTTLTKRAAEDLAKYYAELGLKVQYLHSEMDTFERAEILRDLRLGVYYAVIGVNLLREGIDLPEVSLVAITEADREGYLRSYRSLIQMIGRAARNEAGRVILYADRMTDSIKNALSETNRRRAIQIKFNGEHGITPKTVSKEVKDLLPAELTEGYAGDGSVSVAADGGERRTPGKRDLKELERRMWEAVERLDFELAAELRDMIKGVRGLNDGKFGISMDKNKRSASAQFKKYKRRSAKK